MSNIQDAIENSIEIGEDKKQSIKDVVELLFRGFIEERLKTIITERHLRGIIRAKALNNYLQREYGFRLNDLDRIIEYKTHYIISLHGRGRDDILMIVKNMAEQNYFMDDDNKKSFFRRR